jgi:hypothetical protein
MVEVEMISSWTFRLTWKELSCRGKGLDEHAIGAQRKPFGPCLHNFQSSVSNEVNLLEKHRN